MAKLNKKQAKLVVIKTSLPISMILVQHLSHIRARQTHNTQGTFHTSSALLGKEPSLSSFCFPKGWEFPKANQMP